MQVWNESGSKRARFLKYSEMFGCVVDDVPRDREYGSSVERAPMLATEAPPPAMVYAEARAPPDVKVQRCCFQTARQNEVQ